MNSFTILLALVGAAAFYVVLRRIAVLEQEVRRVESLLVESEDRVRRPAPAAPVPVLVPDIAAPTPAPQRVTASERPPEEPPRVLWVRPNFESLVGERLPIWIGAAALVLAGFFLVRYSIESGLLGPVTRTVLAAGFGGALVAASEAARRLAATRDDPRIAQALAGAGIASLYGTLYLAAALYHLIAPLPAFVAMLGITAAALALSLRHGPPTAVMALIGGFAAPLVAGFDAAGIGPLLAYLALFVAALFGLAIHRGWNWLVLAASVVGFGWINFLAVMLSGRSGELGGVAAFTLLLAAGATAAIPASGLRNQWLRIAPLVAGFIQLVALAPALDFSALAWSFYLVLAGAALFLAAREALYTPAALAALALLLLLEAIALLQPEHRATPIAALVATLLLALPGHWRALRDRDWALLAIGGTAGPLLVAHGCAPALLADAGWGVLELAAAAGCGSIAWRMRGQPEHPALLAGTVVAGFAATLGLAQFVPGAWLAVPLSAVLVALAYWARATQAPRLFALPVSPFAAALVAAALPILGLADLIFASIAGDPLPYVRLPALGDLFRTLALPVAALLATLVDRRALGPLRRGAGTVAIGLALMLAYALAKQGLAIDTEARFLAWGFVERAVITQMCLGAGWVLLRRNLAPSLGGVLLMLGLCRFVWFDLIVLNPVFQPQAVGALPLLNAAVLHAALVAFWLWTLAPAQWFRSGAAVATLVAVLAAVRQAAHGTMLTGPVTTGENGGYSAVLLGLALFWLWRGIAAARHDLRLLGLGLLTAATFKVFLIDAAALDGALRILSFLALGLALIGIGWAYGRFLGKGAAPSGQPVMVGDAIERQ
ncbi:DUF2339 domain-containing protein [Sphingomonas sp. CJ20]